MEKKEEKIKKKYLKKIKKCFPIYGKREKYYLKKLDSHIDEFVYQHPFCSEDDMVQEFGSPSHIAGEYLLEADETYLFHKLRTSHYIKGLIGFIIILMLIYQTYISYLGYLDYKDGLKYHFTTEEIVIETIDGE